MEKVINIARYRSVPYTVNYPTNSGIKVYHWAGSKGNKFDIKPVPQDIVDWLLLNSRCFKDGELAIVDESQEAQEIIENLDDVEEYKNNTNSKDEIVKTLEGNINKMKSTLEKITVIEEKRFVVEVAKEIKLDSSAKLKFLSEWIGIPQDILFAE